MAANITFTDGTGAATLTVATTNGRFNNWTPDPRPVMDHAERLGSGQVDGYEFRDRAQVTFDVMVLVTDLPIAQRLIKHLWRGNTCTVTVADVVSTAAYTNMGIGTSDDGGPIAPQLVRADRETMDYVLTLTVQWVGTGTAPTMTAQY